jgi:glutamate synthase (ferredoxin)
MHSNIQALTSLGCMEHRGACSADNDSGDGAGIMTQIPWDLFKQDFPELNEKTTGCVCNTMQEGMGFAP